MEDNKVENNKIEISKEVILQQVEKDKEIIQQALGRISLCQQMLKYADLPKKAEEVKEKAEAK